MEKFYHFTLMNNFLKLMAYGPRKIAVTGHFGCGKTEFADITEDREDRLQELRPDKTNDND